MGRGTTWTSHWVPGAARLRRTCAAPAPRLPGLGPSRWTRTLWISPGDGPSRSVHTLECKLLPLQSLNKELGFPWLLTQTRSSFGMKDTGWRTLAGPDSRDWWHFLGTLDFAVVPLPWAMVTLWHLTPNFIYVCLILGFPGGSDGKECAC